MHVVRSSEETRRRVDANGWRPRNCVWELTLACNLRCAHCGSVAGRARARELGTADCLRIVDELGDLGCELVTLSGGEPTLRRDWDTIAAAISARGMLVNMVTNGVTRDEAAARSIARRALDAGMCNLGVSVDGPREIHDTMRGAGTWDRTMASIGAFVGEGMRVSVLTTVTKANLSHLAAIRSLALAAGASQWRVQLGKPMGSMAEQRELLLDPDDLLVLIPELARLARLRGITVRVGDSIGYYGPHDKVLRGTGWRGRKECWRGCQAGMQAIGIQADGTVKGCLSLQARWGDRDPFVEGSLAEASLADIWYGAGAFAYNREHRPEDLTGACAACKYGRLCRGGARCVSAAVAQTVTEDPYCWTRVAGEQAPGRWVTAGGAALAVIVALAGCPDTGSAADTTVATDTADVGQATDAVADGGGDGGGDGGASDAGHDTAAQPEYGVSPDAWPSGDVSDASGVSDLGDVVDAAAQPEYGVWPDVTEVECPGWEGDTEDVTPGHDAEPDGALDAADAPTDVSPDAIDCEAVCCECEYGIIPDDVWDQCCKPDPCANVCCDCDYGDPPPPECCK
ncbi:MAG: hypothetical protein AMXMBFR64_33060 [Myxococcales bacterium]